MEIAMTIIMIGEMMPAETAALPKMIPPKIDKEFPSDERISLSLNISKDRINSSASIKAGNGTLTRWA